MHIVFVSILYIYILYIIYIHTQVNEAMACIPCLCAQAHGTHTSTTAPLPKPNNRPIDAPRRLSPPRHPLSVCYWTWCPGKVSNLCIDCHMVIVHVSQSG